MSSSAVEPHNANLLPTSKHDAAAIAYLETLPPSEWSHLVLYNSSTPAPPHAPQVDRSSGLLTWLQDTNWPIATPVSRLLLSLLNNSSLIDDGTDRGARDSHAMILVEAVQRIFRESEDWEWCFHVLLCIVMEIEDKAWMKSMFTVVLREFQERIPARDEEDWAFNEEIRNCLGGESE